MSGEGAVVPGPAARTWRPSPMAVRALRDGLVIAGLAFLAYLFAIEAPRAGTVGFDAYSYWHLDLAHPYAEHAGQFGAFPYTPVLARLLAPAALLSWPAFWWLWTALLLATAIWLGGRWAIVVLAFPPVALELYHGNLNLLIAAAIALGFRYPATWAFVLLSKVTPGVGLLWFLVRREWRHLAIALGVAAVIGIASLVVDARLWSEWISGMVVATTTSPIDQFYVPIPLPIRLVAAAVVVIWGARTDRAWTVPVAAALALPILWPSGLSILAAIAAVGRPELRPDVRPPRMAAEPA